ncbi:MAG TPA: tetratricopeptide repeat protein [Verrucomicrobiae bacterium]|nr:tetratricopeptide repeat protein [Verrucomicrobiae bacterium]
MKEKRRRWFRLAALLLPVVLLLVLEMALRVIGYGYSTSFFLKSGDVYIENQDFTRRYFPPGLSRSPQPVVLKARKPAGTCRIFVFGESAAMGDPEPAFGFPRVLEVLLRQRVGKPVEVVNVAVTAINSHVIRQIAMDCKAMEGDLWIIYMGNNEVVGPFGAGTVFGKQVPSVAFINLTLAFKATRVGQLIGALIRPRTPATWGGMEMFLNQQVRESDPRMSKVYTHFERNLREIVKAAGTRVILSTVAVNLEGCPPFASVAAPEDESAIAQFQKGNFERARDLDTLRFRADSRINDIIRRAAKDLATGFIDPAPRTRAEHFYEHVHFTFEGNYLIARMLADEAGRLLPEFGSVTNNWISQQRCAELLAYTEWDQFQIVDEMVQRLDLPPFTNQAGHVERMQRLKELRAKLESALKPENHERWIKSYTAAIANASNDWVLHENFAKLLQHIGDASGAEREWRKVAELLPHSAAAWYGLGNVLDGVGKSAEALDCFRKALSLKPGAVEARNGLGLTLASQGRTADAEKQYREALRQKADFVEARVNLGLLLTKEGKVAEAINEYRAALRANSNSVAAHMNLGNALAAQNSSEALSHYAEAVRLKPDFAQAHYLYGMELTKTGGFAEAIPHLQRAVQLDSSLVEAHFNLGVGLAKQQRFAEAVPEFEAAVRLDPKNALARKYLDQARARAKP